MKIFITRRFDFSLWYLLPSISFTHDKGNVIFYFDFLFFGIWIDCVSKKSVKDLEESNKEWLDWLEEQAKKNETN